MKASGDRLARISRSLFSLLLLSSFASESISQSQAGRIALSAKAITGYKLLCHGVDQFCYVPVKITTQVDQAGNFTGCTATIDYEQVRLKNGRKVYFVLVNADSGKKLEHVFDKTENNHAKGGLNFHPNLVPPPSQLAFRDFLANDTVAEWQGRGNSTVEAGHAYVPEVRTASGVRCTPGDPVIANDG